MNTTTRIESNLQGLKALALSERYITASESGRSALAASVAYAGLPMLLKDAEAEKVRDGLEQLKEIDTEWDLVNSGY